MMNCLVTIRKRDCWCFLISCVCYQQANDAQNVRCGQNQQRPVGVPQVGAPPPPGALHQDGGGSVQAPRRRTQAAEARPAAGALRSAVASLLSVAGGGGVAPSGRESNSPHSNWTSVDGSSKCALGRGTRCALECSARWAARQRIHGEHWSAVAEPNKPASATVGHCGQRQLSVNHLFRRRYSAGTRRSSFRARRRWAAASS